MFFLHLWIFFHWLFSFIYWGNLRLKPVLEVKSQCFTFDNDNKKYFPLYILSFFQRILQYLTQVKKYFWWQKPMFYQIYFTYGKKKPSG